MAKDKLWPVKFMGIFKKSSLSKLLKHWGNCFFIFKLLGTNGFIYKRLGIFILLFFFNILIFSHSFIAVGEENSPADSAGSGATSDDGRRLLDILKGNTGLKPFKVPEYLSLEFGNPAVGFNPIRLKYIIQDKTGAVIGNLEVKMETDFENDRLVAKVVKRYNLGSVTEVTIVVKADDFSPLRAMLKRAETPSEDERNKAEGLSGVNLDNSANNEELKPICSAYYYYDLVTVDTLESEAQSFFAFRRFLPSYDIDEILLILTAVEISDFPKKTLWFLTSPFGGANHITLVERIGKRVVYGADAERHTCEVLKFSSQSFSDEYCVRSISPQRVIKFTAGDLTFTLWEDEENPPDIIIGGER